MIQERSKEWENNEKEMMECFRLPSLGLDEKQLTLIEDYLQDKINEEDLNNKIVFKDLSRIGHAAEISFNDCMSKLMNNKRDEEVLKFFNAFFAVGQSTSDELLPRYFIGMFNESPAKLFGIAPAKICSIYAKIITYYGTSINIQYFNTLKKLANEDPKIILDAAAYKNGQSDSQKLVLLTCYFYIKYQNNGQDLEDRSVGQEDKKLLEEYEEIVLSNLENLFQSNSNIIKNRLLSTEEIAQVIKAVKENRLDSETKILSGGIELNRYLSYLIGGCAFVNFRLSKLLKDVVRLCFRANANITVTVMKQMDLRGDLLYFGENFDSIFGIDTEVLFLGILSEITQIPLFSFDLDKPVSWNEYNKTEKIILEHRFINDRESYLQYFGRANYRERAVMICVIAKKDAALYKTLTEQEREKEFEQVMSVLTEDENGRRQLVKAYLRGEESIDALCAAKVKIKKSESASYKAQELVEYFRFVYQDEAFYRRCEAYMIVSEKIEFLRKRRGGIMKDIAQVLRECNQEHVPVANQLYAAILLEMELGLYGEEQRTAIFHGVKEAFIGYLEEQKKEIAEAFLQTDANWRYLALEIFQTDGQACKTEILQYAKDTSKNVREKLTEILRKHEDWEQDVIALLGSSKAAEREFAVHIIQLWKNPKHKEALKSALEKEKSTKIRTQIMGALSAVSEENSSGSAFTQEELVKETLKSNKKRAIAWAYETPFPIVHKKDGTQADEDYLQAIFIYYASMPKCGISREAATLAEGLDTEEFAVYVNALFEKWLAAGAESKKRWVLYAAAIHGGAEIIKKLQHHIQEWPQNLRGAIAGEAVQAMTLSPQPQALLLVDGIARKFKYKQVKAAASKALDFAAEELGLTRAQFEDKIVPNLGFDENMERIFDYGKRKFTVAITSTLELEVIDDNGKKLKNLPTPGKQDDEQKAAEAYADYKAMKSQLKKVVSSQKERLEAALSTARRWTGTEWKTLFVKNPIMHQFAICLIWGIYEDSEQMQLKQSFRYMEDGSFNTAQGDACDIPEDAKIGLVHPIELSEEEKTAWTEQLEDYELKQPFTQLNRKVFMVTEKEKAQKSLERFGGYVVSALSLAGKMQKYGWFKGSVLDGGGFFTFYREDPELGLGTELHFSGTYVAVFDEDVTLYEVRFYKAGTIERGSYVYDEVGDKNSVSLGEIPKRYFSEVVLQLSEITQKSKERNENWKRY